MKIGPAFSAIVLLFILPVLIAEDTSKDRGAISGRISPKEASVRIIAKKAGSEYRIKENIIGEVTLIQGGTFTIKSLPPGKYDLLFFLQGKSQKTYFATRWSEIIVQPGKTTSGINYRLTPLSSKYLVDEILVSFKEDVKAGEARKIIQAAGCVIKDAPLHLGAIHYTLDIPDGKSVKDMIEVFKEYKKVAYAERVGITTVDVK